MDFWYLCLSMSIVEPQDVHWVHCELLLRWEIWVTFVSGLSESLWPALLAPQSNRSGGSFAWISESINLYLYIIIYIYYNIYIYRSENLRIWMILNVKYGKGHFEELICTDLYCGHFFSVEVVGIPLESLWSKAWSERLQSSPTGTSHRAPATGAPGDFRVSKGFQRVFQMGPQ